MACLEGDSTSAVGSKQPPPATGELRGELPEVTMLSLVH